jgi:hypothetical protein
MTENDLHYLRSILGHLREVRKVVEGAGLGGEVLADNIDWLDCFIERNEREVKAADEALNQWLREHPDMDPTREPGSQP